MKKHLVYFGLAGLSAWLVFLYFSSSSVSDQSSNRQFIKSLAVAHPTTLTVVEIPNDYRGEFSVIDTPASFKKQQEIIISIIEDAVLKEVNKLREKHELPPLAVNRLLVDSAEYKGEYLIENELFAHSTEERSFISWFDGIPLMYFGENLARGFTSASEVVEAWEQSSGHYDLMVSDDFQEAGVFVGTTKDGQMLVVIHFGGVFTTL